MIRTSYQPPIKYFRHFFKFRVMHLLVINFVNNCSLYLYLIIKIYFNLISLIQTKKNPQLFGKKINLCYLTGPYVFHQPCFYTDQL